MKIKVKRVRGGSMGDQRDYGLVTGSIWNYEDKPSTNQVSETMSPVDRDEATIEAERGETIVGDLNNDGMLEHVIVGGKRHFEGGTPLNVPDGSFVFSDTRSLLIKNKDVLKNIFGISASKGMTPAKVAKRFDLNQYNSILMDPDTDPMSKKTAQMMLDNNLKKLGQLALVQEGMKGFPDGIPDIAAPLFGSDIAVSQASQEGMARRGGLLKAQTGNAGVNSKKNDMMHKKVTEKAFKNAYEMWRNAKTVEEEKRAIQIMGNLGKVPENVIQYHAEKGTLKKVGLPYTSLDYALPEGTSSYNQQQLAGAKAAQQLFVAGMAATNPQVVRELQSKLDDINIPGKSTPMGSLATITLGAIERGVQSVTGLPVRPFTEGFDRAPLGLTWQEKINDMRDILRNKADFLELKEKNTRTRESVKEEVKDYTSKYNEVQSTLKNILTNPENYSSEQVQKAIDWNETINDPRFLGIPTRFIWEENPYRQTTRTKVTSISDFDTKKNIDKAFEELTKKSAAKKSEPVEEITPTQESYAETPTAPADSTGIAPSDTSGTNIQVNTTGTGPGAITRVPKTMSDQDVINMLKSSAEYGPDEEPTPQEISAFKSAMGLKKLGGDLPKHKVTGPVVYNLRDKKFQEEATKKGFIPIRKWSWHDPNLPAVGTQRKLSPSGIYTFEGGPEPVIEDLRNYPGVTDWTEYAPGGFDQWKADMAAAKGRPSKASKFFDTKRDEYEISKSGMTSVDRSLRGANVPGYENFSPYEFMRAPSGGGQDVFTPEPSPVATTPAKSGPAAPPATNYVTPNYRQPWSNYSMVDYLASMGNYMDVRRGQLPTLYQYTPKRPDYTLLDPSRAYAEQQGLVAQSTEDIASRSMDPTTGRANIIAAQAQASDPIANIQAKYDEANAQIVNQNEQQYANMMNDAQLKNIGYRRQYEVDLVTLEQQYQNALREGRTEVAESIKRAMVDAMQRGALNEQNTNYAIDPSGVIYFKPGYDPKTGINVAATDPRVEMYKNLRKDYNEKDAKNIMDLMYGKKAQQGGATAYVPFAAYNPMDLIWG